MPLESSKRPYRDEKSTRVKQKSQVLSYLSRCTLALVMHALAMTRVCNYEMFPKF